MMDYLYFRWRLMLTVMVTLFAMGFSATAYAGVGILQEDEQSLSENLSFSGSNKQWDGNRNVLTSICERRNFDLSLGYEYGWSYFHTVYSSVNLAYRKCGVGFNRSRVPGAPPGFRISTPYTSGRAWGLGDVTLGIRTRFGGNYLNNAAWETFLIIPTGYDNNSPSALGRGGLGTGLALILSSDATDRYPYKWGYSPKKWAWKAGTKLTYFFASKGNSLATFAAVQYAFTVSDFEQTGDFIEFRLDNSIGFQRGGIQQQVFINQAPSAMTNSDQTSFKIKYSHAFIATGWSASISLGHAFFGRNAPKSTSVALGTNYRWRD